MLTGVIQALGGDGRELAVRPDKARANGRSHWVGRARGGRPLDLGNVVCPGKMQRPGVATRPGDVLLGEDVGRVRGALVVPMDDF